MLIKKTLLAALQNDEHALDHLCSHCISIATAYLQVKAGRNSLLLHQIYKNIDDMALDCIADLFERNHNQLVQLNRYFNSNEISNLKESEITSKLRRLIFSKVNEGIFRNYRNFDPSLSKIIRNIKRTLEEQKVKGAFYNKELGLICFEPSVIKKPMMADEILEAKLFSKLNVINNTVDAINHLKIILISESDYAPQIPLIGFASLLRKLFAHQWLFEKEFNEQSLKLVDEDLSKQDFEFLIERSLSKKKNSLYNTYVVSKKITESDFIKYLTSATEILKSEFVKDSVKSGYFEHFCSAFPNIEYEEYRNQHRKILEYIVKQVREQLISSEIKKEEKLSRLRRW